MALSGGGLRPLKDRAAELEFHVSIESGRNLGLGPLQVKAAKKRRQAAHFTGTYTLTTSLSGLVVTGSEAYSSMNSSLASSRLSSR